MSDPEPLNLADCEIRIDGDGSVQIFYAGDSFPYAADCLVDSLFETPEELLLADIMLLD